MSSWGQAQNIAGSGFAAYVRILHPVPATRLDLTTVDEFGVHPELESTRWRWAEVARRNNMVMHPQVQWSAISVGDEATEFDDGWVAHSPEIGQQTPQDIAMLCEHLQKFTTTPEDLIAAVWAGWGELNIGASAVFVSTQANWFQRRRAQKEHQRQQREAILPEIHRAIRRKRYLELPDREYIMLETGCAELSDPTWIQRAGLGWQPDWPSTGVTPQLIWPEDHAWVVGSEIDWDSTIVSGPHELIESIHEDDRLESFIVEPTADISWYGDQINPAAGLGLPPED